jgi:hypothetical protein
MGSLTPENKKYLLSKGFLLSEIKKLDKGYINTGSHTYKSMVRSRELWVDSMRKVGWNKKQIDARIRHWYSTKKDRTPFDWLKVEYKPTNKLTIKQLAKQLELRRGISRTFGRAYGRIRSQKVMKKIGYKGIPKPGK